MDDDVGVSRHDLGLSRQVRALLELKVPEGPRERQVAYADE